MGKHTIWKDDGSVEEWEEEAGPHPKRSRIGSQKMTGMRPFTEDLQAAVKALGLDGKPRYKYAAMFAFHWSNSDFNVVNLRDELQEVLVNLYGFQTRSHVIDARDDWKTCHVKLSAALTQFKASFRLDEPCLLVYYYSGHAAQGYQSTGYSAKTLKRMHLFGAKSPDGGSLGPYIDWNEFTGQLQGYTPYHTALGIMDCCSAALTGLGEDMEVMAASVWDTEAPISQNHCFTRAVIDELKRVGGRSITALALVSRIQHYATAAKLQNTMPIYRPATNSSRPLAVFYNMRASQPPPPALNAPIAYVTISINLETHGLSTAQQWAEWLTSNVPQDIRKISIDAVYETKSLTIIVTMPFQLWCLLPDRSAYSFIQHVKGPARDLQIADTLSAPSGRENIPPGGSSGRPGSSGQGRGTKHQQPSSSASASGYRASR